MIESPEGVVNRLRLVEQAIMMMKGNTGVIIMDPGDADCQVPIVVITIVPSAILTLQ